MRLFALISRRLRSLPLMKRAAGRSVESISKTKKAALSRHITTEPPSSSSSRNSKMIIVQEKQDSPLILPNPIKSENDKKEYRVIKLKNGLTALLISKPEDPTVPADDASMSSDHQSDDSISSGGSDGESVGSDGENDKDQGTHQSAASLTIGVGSFEDPDDVPGLAHFLEHMVFMGSEKFPQENDFDAFIKKQGGEDNASTDWDDTTFYFVSQTPGFKDGLDRFAQFFISPLLKKEAMQREREAIESEFNLALPSDYHRKKQLISSLAKKGHPATKFSWGNIASLGGGVGKDQEKRDSEVHQKLQEFRKKHYVAESMTLAVQSTHDLDTLQQWVTEFFSLVPTGNVSGSVKKPQVVNDSLKLPFDTPEFKRLYNVKPVKDVQEVSLTWSLPSMLDKYKSKPDRYLSWILGYEGKGSLVQYLRDKVWALQLYAGSDDSGADHNSHFLHFGITVSLTEEGCKHMDEVLHAIFSYLNLMRQEGPQERIFKELQKIQETKFRFSPEPSPGDNVEDLSESMQKYPSEHYLVGSDLFFDYDPEAITHCLSQLRHDNVNVMVLNNGNKETYKNKEVWFNTPYNAEDIPKSWLSEWESAIPLDSFTLPEPNRYLTTDFDIYGLEKDDDDVDMEYPKNIVNNSLGELWFKQDTKFSLPRAYIIFQLVSPIIFLSPENACMLDLMIGGWKQTLSTEAYPAEVAELSYSINPSESGTGQGISIMVAGYNQNLPLLLETVLNEWVKFEDKYSNELFVAIKAEMKKTYYNTALKPSKLLKDINNSLLKSVHWTVIEKYEAIDDISFEQLKMFSKLLKKRLYCRMLIQGNMLKQQAVNVLDIVHRTLKFKPLISNTWPQLRMAQLSVGETLMTMESVNKNSSNSAVAQTFHCGPGKLKDIAVAEMIMLLFEEAAFDYLRTKEQLGYSVGTSISIVKGILKFTVTVENQEDKNSIFVVDSKIQDFLVKFYDDLKKMTEPELEELRKSAMIQKLQADLQLREELDRNWEEVYTGEHMFDRRKHEHALLSIITHDEMTTWFEKYVFDSNNRRILTLAVQGLVKSSNQTTSEKDSTTVCSHKEMCLKLVDSSSIKRSNVTSVNNIADFKRGLFYYPNFKVLD